MPNLDRELKKMLKNISDKQISQSTVDYINFILYKVLEVLTEKINNFLITNKKSTYYDHINILENFIPDKLGFEIKKYSYSVEYATVFIPPDKLEHNTKKIKMIINSLKIRKIIEDKNFKHQLIMPHDIFFMSTIIEYIAMKILKLSVDEANNRGKQRIERCYLIREINNKDQELRDFIENLFDSSLGQITDNVYVI